MIHVVEVIDVVVDTSIILALLKSEAIDQRAFALIDGAVMSAVNVAEVSPNSRTST